MPAVDHRIREVVIVHLAVGVHLRPQRLTRAKKMLDTPAHVLDVLPRHRLLPQPSGFEGLFGIEVTPNPNRLAVLEVDYGGERWRGLDTALFTARNPAADCDDSIAEIPDFRELDPELAESLVQVAEHLSHAIVSPVHRRGASQRSQDGGLPLHVGVEFLQHRFYISAVVRVRKAFESLDVLLRHRPPSIPLGLLSANGDRRPEPPRREGRGLPAAVRYGRPPAARVSRGRPAMAPRS